MLYFKYKIKGEIYKKRENYKKYINNTYIHRIRY